MHFYRVDWKVWMRILYPPNNRVCESQRLHSHSNLLIEFGLRSRDVTNHLTHPPDERVAVQTLEARS